MNKKKLQTLYLGWDVGGAHTKLSVTKPNSSSFHIYRCHLWESLDLLSKLVNSVCSKYNKRFNIINVITMSGEMSDIFESRDQGVKNILNIFKSSGDENYVFSSKKPFFLKLKAITNTKSVSSMNWLATAKFLETCVNNAIAVDIGSTTTDIIIIKNGVCKNVGYDDFSRLSHSELIYTGILRTPLFAVTNQITNSKHRFPVIPEYFSNMSDIYRIMSDIDSRKDYSDSCDHRGKTYMNSLIRFARSLGFDYQPRHERKLKNLAKEIKLIQKSFIMEKIIVAMANNFSKKETINLIGLGIGSFLVREICHKIKLTYKDFNAFYKGDANKLFLPSDIAPAYSISMLLKFKNEQN